jgi:hypothetical protein
VRKLVHLFNVNWYLRLFRYEICEGLLLFLNSAYNVAISCAPLDTQWSAWGRHVFHKYAHLTSFLTVFSFKIKPSLELPSFVGWVKTTVHICFYEQRFTHYANHISRCCMVDVSRYDCCMIVIFVYVYCAVSGNAVREARPWRSSWVERSMRIEVFFFEILISSSLSWCLCVGCY